MALIVSAKVKEKLSNKQPPVTKEQIEECFATRTGKYLIDEREEHASNPPTRWFISETYYGRKLKVVFIPQGEDVVIRTAYDPNEEEKRIYKKFGL